MNWLRRFMMGRYVVDQLSMALLILSFLLTAIAELTRLPILVFIAYVPLVISIFRILSRNMVKRRLENYKFVMAMGPVYSWFRRLQRRVKDSKTHRYFKCPNCKASLRVPKGKGKIIVICPRCRTEFSRKT